MAGFGSLAPADDERSLFAPDIGALMPEVYGRDQISDPLLKTAKKTFWDVPKGLIDTARTTPYGLRREDVTDIPGSAQPIDPLVGRSVDVASRMIGAPAVGPAEAAAGETVIGSSAVRSAAIRKAAGKTMAGPAAGTALEQRRPAELSIHGAREMAPEEAPATPATETPPSGAPTAPDWSRMNQPFGAVTDPGGEVVAGTAKVPITQRDIDRAINVGMAVSGGGLATKVPKALPKIVPEVANPAFARGTGVMPQLAERYPETVPPTLTYKGTGKAVPAEDIPTGAELERRLALPKKDPQAIYPAKETSPEAAQLSKVRLGMKPDIEAGKYKPYFPPELRTDVDPATHGEYHDTSQNVMKKPATRAQYDLMAGNQDAVARLNEAYARGLQQKDAAGNWYFMKQLQDEFVNEYGPLMGPRLFKERFAESMAATTGGADPTANFLMAHYGNYLKAKGLPVPESHQFPYPIGGQYAGENMDQFRKMIMEGEGIDPMTNEKRYNFAGNFLGRAKQATIDKQMSGLFDPGIPGKTKALEKPAPGSYGHYEQVLQSLAAHHGVDPRYFQEVAWAGAKDMKTPGGYVAKPMISHVNDAIERTHRITGMPRAEIVRRGLVRSEIPIYGVMGAAGAAGFGSLVPPSAEERQ